MYHLELKTEFDILEKMLSYSNDLSRGYDYLQIYLAFDNKDVEKFREENILNKKHIILKNLNKKT